MSLTRKPVAQLTNPVRNSNAVIATALAAPGEANHPPETHWYDYLYDYLKIGAKGAIALSLNAVRDLVWAAISSKDWNVLFRRTLSEGEQILGQQVWASVAVFAAAPLAAYGWSRVYREESFKNCLIYALIASISTLAALAPWDGLQIVGIKFFTDRGFDNATVSYLASLFPGPGTVEGPIQNIVTTVLSWLLDPNFTFDAIAFALLFSPISFVAGDSWQFAYAIMAGVAALNIGGVFAQALAVMFTVLTMNYLTMIIVAILCELIRKFCACGTSHANDNAGNVVRDNIAVLRRGSPVHVEIPMQVLGQASNAPSMRNRADNAV